MKSMKPPATEAGKRLKLAAEMADSGRAMMRESLKRRFPADSEAEIDARFAAAITDRPGDGPGVVGPWPRR